MSTITNAGTQSRSDGISVATSNSQDQSRRDGTFQSQNLLCRAYGTHSDINTFLPTFHAYGIGSRALSFATIDIQIQQ